jgi:hypothetical protein
VWRDPPSPLGYLWSSSSVWRRFIKRKGVKGVVDISRPRGQWGSEPVPASGLLLKGLDVRLILLENRPPFLSSLSLSVHCSKVSTEFSYFFPPFSGDRWKERRFSSGHFIPWTSIALFVVSEASPYCWAWMSLCLCVDVKGSIFIISWQKKELSYNNFLRLLYVPNIPQIKQLSDSNYEVT